MLPSCVPLNTCCYQVLLLTIIIVYTTTGELLGQRGPNLTVTDVNDWPRASEFFNNFGLPSKPLVARGVGVKSPAFRLWTDEYLRQHVDNEMIVTVEREKKEDRQNGIAEGLTFDEFLSRYQKEQMYMVQDIPETLKKDVIVPAPLQCHVMSDSIAISLMWFSSGGTSSVLHIDSMDNINCVLSGHKHVVLIDRKYSDKVSLDHPSENYCGVDVDSVDFDKYPGLLEVEYYHVDLHPGDCLFIPYRWFHQVRSSQERNIAVNVWWKHYTMKKQNFGQCLDIPPEELKTFDKFTLAGMDNTFDELDLIRDHVLSVTRNYDGPMEYDDFKVSIFKPPPDETGREIFFTMSEELFLHLDDNYDDIIDFEEVSSLEESVWQEISVILGEFTIKVQEYERIRHEEEWKEHENMKNEFEEDEHKQDESILFEEQVKEHEKMKDEL